MEGGQVGQIGLNVVKLVEAVLQAEPDHVQILYQKMVVQIVLAVIWKTRSVLKLHVVSQ